MLENRQEEPRTHTPGEERQKGPQAAKQIAEEAQKQTLATAKRRAGLQIDNPPEAAGLRLTGLRPYYTVIPVKRVPFVVILGAVAYFTHSVSFGWFFFLLAGQMFLDWRKSLQ